VVSQRYPNNYTLVKMVCSRGLATKAEGGNNSVSKGVLEAILQVIVNA